MVRHAILILLIFVTGFSASAQKRDSIYVQQGEDGWIIAHRIKKGETVFSVARNYHIPPAMLSDANEISLQQALTPGAVLEIPLGAYNLKTETGMYTGEMRPIYHRLHTGESLKRIARNSGVSQRRLLEWNDMTAEHVYDGVIFRVGWLLYDATGTTLPPLPDPRNTTATPPVQSVQDTSNHSTPVVKRNNPNVVAETIKIPKVTDTGDADTSKSEAEMTYEIQTAYGITTEKGPAAFFKSNNKTANFYYAFHNEAPKGTIIKVRNTNNGRSVFVKVLGTIPNTGLYHNCIIGISSRAKTDLGVRDEKTWCELTYGK